jgi:hypothetical protein
VVPLVVPPQTDRVGSTRVTDGLLARGRITSSYVSGNTARESGLMLLHLDVLFTVAVIGELGASSERDNETASMSVTSPPRLSEFRCRRLDSLDI